MNKDSHLIFELYKSKNNSVLNEGPVSFEPEYKGTGEEIKAEFPELAKGKYALDEAQTAQVLSKFVQKFKEEGGKSPMLYKDFYEANLSPIVREVNPSINNTNAKYASRVLYNALRAAGALKDERDGVEGVKGAKAEHSVKKIAKVAAENPEEFAGEESEPEIKKTASYSPYVEYYFKTIDEIPSGTLEGDLKIQYERLSNLTGESMKGSDFEKQIQRYNLPTSLVSKFVRAGVLVPAGEDEDTGDTSDIGKSPEEIAQSMGYKGAPEYQKFSQGKDFWSSQY